MQVTQKGFTLLEMLIAITISSVVLLGAARLFPALLLNVSREYQHISLYETLWQLVFTIGKNLQRAGYCHGQCQGEGLKLLHKGECVLIQWDENSNGRWETGGGRQSEQTGYRLRAGSLETLRGATACEGGGWERITDPDTLTVEHFLVMRQARNNSAPRLIITLAARLKKNGRILTLRHAVVGHNL